MPASGNKYSWLRIETRAYFQSASLWSHISPKGLVWNKTFNWYSPISPLRVLFRASQPTEPFRQSQAKSPYNPSEKTNIAESHWSIAFINFNSKNYLQNDCFSIKKTLTDWILPNQNSNSRVTNIHILIHWGRTKRSKFLQTFSTACAW